LAAAFSAAPLMMFANYVDPTSVHFKGQGAAVLIGLFAILVSLVLWVPYRSEQSLPALAIVGLSLILLAWMMQSLLIQLDGSLFNLTTFSIPLITLMILIKPPSMEDAQMAGRVFAYLLIVIGSVALVLDSIHVTQSAFIASRTGYSRIPILSQLGMNTRWEGPYGNVNYAGPVGAFLIVYGAGQRHSRKWILIAGGLFILILSQTRSAVFGLVAGLLVLALFSKHVAQWRYATLIRWGFSLVLALVGSLYILAFDRSMAFRTEVWSDYFTIWKTSPWLGVGDSGIKSYTTTGLPNDAGLQDHGHSIIIDTLARYGIGLLLVYLAVFAVTVVLGVWASRVGQPMGLALVVSAFVGGLAETTLTWSYLGFFTVPVVLALLLSAGAMSNQRALVFSGKNLRKQKET